MPINVGTVELDSILNTSRLDAQFKAMVSRLQAQSAIAMKPMQPPPPPKPLPAPQYKPNPNQPPAPKPNPAPKLAPEIAKAKEFNQAILEWDSSLKKTQNSGASVKSLFEGIGAGAGFAVTTGAINALKGALDLLGQGISASLGQFIQLDNAIKQTGVISSSTGTPELAALRQEVQRLGLATSKSPDEIGAVTVALSRSGFAADEQTKALEGVVRASEASGDSLALTGDIIGKTVRVFALSADESMRVADALVATANNTNTSMDSLGESLKYVGPAAKASNQPLEDTLVLIGLLGDQGIQGSSAGTGLAAALDKLKVASAGNNSEFAGLLKGSKAATTAYNAIGASVRNADGSMKSVLEILPELKQNMQDLSKEDQDILFKALFGVQGGRTIAALLNTTDERLELVTDRVQNAAGVSKEAGEAMLAGLGGILDLLDGTIKTLAANIGQIFAPAVEFMLRQINQILYYAAMLVGQFNALPGPVRAVATAVVALSTAAGAAIVALTAYNAAVKTKALQAALATIASAKQAVALAFETTQVQIATAAKYAYAVATKGAAGANAQLSASSAKAAASIGKAAATGLLMAGAAVAVMTVVDGYTALRKAGIEANKTVREVDRALRDYRDEAQKDEGGGAVDAEAEAIKAFQDELPITTKLIDGVIWAINKVLDVVALVYGGWMRHVPILKEIVAWIEKIPIIGNLVPPAPDEIELPQYKDAALANNVMALDKFKGAAQDAISAAEDFDPTGMSKEEATRQLEDLNAAIDAAKTGLEGYNAVGAPERQVKKDYLEDLEEAKTKLEAATAAADEFAVSEEDAAAGINVAEVELRLKEGSVQTLRDQLSGAISPEEAAAQVGKMEEAVLAEKVKSVQAQLAEAEAGSVGEKKLRSDLADAEKELVAKQIENAANLKEARLNELQETIDEAKAKIDADAAKESNAIKYQVLMDEVEAPQAEQMQLNVDLGATNEEMDLVKKQIAEVNSLKAQGVLTEKEAAGQIRELEAQYQDLMGNRLDILQAVKEAQIEALSTPISEEERQQTEIDSTGAEAAIRQQQQAGIIGAEEAEKQIAQMREGYRQQELTAITNQIAQVNAQRASGAISEQVATQALMNLNQQKGSLELESINARIAADQAATASAVAGLEEQKRMADLNTQAQLMGLDQIIAKRESMAAVEQSAFDAEKSAGALRNTILQNALKNAQAIQQDETATAAEKRAALRDEQALQAELQAEREAAAEREYQFAMQQLELERQNLDLLYQKQKVEADIAVRQAELELAKAKLNGASEEELALLNDILNLTKEGADAIDDQYENSKKVLDNKEKTLKNEKAITDQNNKQAAAEEKKALKTKQAAQKAGAGSGSSKGFLTAQGSDIGTLNKARKDFSEAVNMGGKMGNQISELLKFAQNDGSFRSNNGKNQYNDAYLAAMGGESGKAALLLEKLADSGDSLQANQLAQVLDKAQASGDGATFQGVLAKLEELVSKIGAEKNINIYGATGQAGQILREVQNSNSGARM